MESPLEGLKALVRVLRPSGTIKFSVYSRAARAATLAAIELRKSLGISPTTEGINELRNIIRALPRDHPAAPVVNSRDFGTRAGCRDLLFHVQEHNFTIPELVELVEAAGLKILSWGPSTSVTKLESMGYPNTTDWRIWHEAELKRPGLFSNGMYTLAVTR